MFLNWDWLTELMRFYDSVQAIRSRTKINSMSNAGNDLINDYITWMLISKGIAYVFDAWSNERMNELTKCYPLFAFSQRRIPSERMLALTINTCEHLLNERSRFLHSELHSRNILLHTESPRTLWKPERTSIDCVSFSSLHSEAFDAQ